MFSMRPIKGQSPAVDEKQTCPKAGAVRLGSGEHRYTLGYSNRHLVPGLFRQNLSAMLAGSLALDVVRFWYLQEFHDQRDHALGEERSGKSSA